MRLDDDEADDDDEDELDVDVFKLYSIKINQYCSFVWNSGTK